MSAMLLFISACGNELNEMPLGMQKRRHAAIRLNPCTGKAEYAPPKSAHPIIITGMQLATPFKHKGGVPAASNFGFKSLQKCCTIIS